MKILLDIKDNKAAFIIELLRNFKFVKTELLTPYKAKILQELTEAVKEVNEIKSGKRQGKSLSEFLNDL